MILDRSTATAGPAAKDLRVKHRRTEIDGVGVFYREAGPEGAPVVLLPHG